MEVNVPITNELEKLIADAFVIFDHQGDKQIDIREIGTILRFLGCVPTEQQVNEVIAETELEDASGEVHLSRFLPHVCYLISERQMEPASPEKLLDAFHVLDPEGRGYITKEHMSKIMMEEGEPFTQEEVDEMKATAVDPITGNIPYEFYLKQLAHMQKVSIYDIADRVYTDKFKAIKTTHPNKRSSGLPSPHQS